jgi:hypothetical protein
MLNTKSIPKGASLTVIFSLIFGTVRYSLLEKSQPHEQSGYIHGHYAQTFYLADISLARQNSILSACVATAVICGFDVKMLVIDGQLLRCYGCRVDSGKQRSFRVPLAN